MNTTEIVYFKKPKFIKAMEALRRRGGQHARAASEANRIIGSLSHGFDETNKITNHGENRIKSCVKYDLGAGAFRLVTVHSNHCIYILYVGSHDDADQWIERHRGYTFTYNRQSKEVGSTVVSSGPDRRPLPDHNMDEMPIVQTPYVKRIPRGFDVSRYLKSRSLIREINLIDDTTTDDLLMEVVAEAVEQSPEIGALVFDLLSLVREGDLDGAAERIKLHEGKSVPVQDLESDEIEAVHDYANSDRLVVLTGMSESELERVLAPQHFHEWMLFPHPDQKRIANEIFEKPAILTGVSGSGKTCILLHRAKYLASKYTGQRIGILTLNRTLASLLRNLLAELCPETERRQIEVFAFYDYFKQLVDWFGPEAELSNLRKLAEEHEEAEHILRAINQVNPSTYAREFDPISGETLDDTFKIFLDNPRVATLMTYFREHLHAHDDWADSAKYLSEEFSLIRSALATDSRVDGYVSRDFAREGRSIPFPEKVRRLTLDLLLHFEEEMLTGGILDELSLTLALLPHLRDFSTMPDRFRFRCLLVDEYQDLSTRDLTLLRRVVDITAPDSFFLCGDSVQKVLVKSLNLHRAGLAPVDTIRRRIRKNYRNSKNILMAASNLAKIYGEMARKLNEDVETLDPELAVRETAWPLAIEAKPGDEICHAWRHAQEVIQAGSSLAWSVCIVTACDEDAYSVQAILDACPPDFPIKAERLTGDYTRHQDTMTVASMADVKGFEFSMVFVVGCGKQTLPNPGRPKDEAWRDALRLYVAMTRARDGVQLFYSGEASPFLLDMNEHIEWLELNA
jgi:superfamily I DNA/RNA helicase